MRLLPEFKEIYDISTRI